MNIDQLSVLSGFTSTLAVLTIIIIRQKRFDRSDLGILGTVYITGFNIPASLFLCFYVFYPNTLEVFRQSDLLGYEKFFSFSGGALLFLSLSAIWDIVKKSYKIRIEAKTE